MVFVPPQPRTLLKQGPIERPNLVSKDFFRHFRMRSVQRYLEFSQIPSIEHPEVTPLRFAPNIDQEITMIQLMYTWIYSSDPRSQFTKLLPRVLRLPVREELWAYDWKAHRDAIKEHVTFTLWHDMSHLINLKVGLKEVRRLIPGCDDAWIPWKDILPIPETEVPNIVPVAEGYSPCESSTVCEGHRKEREADYAIHFAMQHVLGLSRSDYWKLLREDFFKPTPKEQRVTPLKHHNYDFLRSKEIQKHHVYDYLSLAHPATDKPVKVSPFERFGDVVEEAKKKIEIKIHRGFWRSSALYGCRKFYAHEVYDEMVEEMISAGMQIKRRIQEPYYDPTQDEEEKAKRCTQHTSTTRSARTASVAGSTSAATPTPARTNAWTRGATPPWRVPRDEPRKEPSPPPPTTTDDEKPQQEEPRRASEPWTVVGKRGKPADKMDSWRAKSKVSPATSSTHHRTTGTRAGTRAGAGAWVSKSVQKRKEGKNGSGDSMEGEEAPIRHSF